MLFTPSYAQAGSGAHTSSNSIDKSGSFLVKKRWCVKFITHLHLVQRLRMGFRQLSASRQAQCLHSDLRMMEMI